MKEKERAAIAALYELETKLAEVVQALSASDSELIRDEFKGSDLQRITSGGLFSAIREFETTNQLE